ncbi:MAG TPA: hypothetical protein VGK14_04930 [Novimethylophilus sp.]|jgi:hypothetical protein|uniref:hypothetical protein n=1 Tax=Novimethylophilus sp. TaxID=2137426 RepID=UPI002F3EFCD3
MAAPPCDAGAALRCRLLAKYWLSGVQSAWLANGMYYGALLLGLYYGFRPFFVA